MAAAPFMPLYVSEYLADTPHLSALEHGAYLMLIMAYWQKGEALPNDDRKLARAARVSDKEWLRIRDDMAEFFDIEGDRWTHNRVEFELDKARTKVEAARNAGRASAERRLNGRSTKVQPVREDKSKKVEGETPNPFAGEAWDGWIESRKKKPTARAIDLAIKTLTELQAKGQNPEAVLNQSTLNGWTGLFPLKGNANGNGIDRRDGLAKALDRRLGLDDAPGPFGRRDAGAGEGDRLLPPPRSATER